MYVMAFQFSDDWYTKSLIYIKTFMESDVSSFSVFHLIELFSQSLIVVHRTASAQISITEDESNFIFFLGNPSNLELLFSENRLQSLAIKHSRPNGSNWLFWFQVLYFKN